ncbi:hypothetical protein NDU88_006919 [Pleurodeles waltl]|uniref:Uncharacterized protein n=1 Tax=Pleurodeles waltl TaxID=8319 RepID=A0AAV7RRN1_PLEWA|nr:hypothetical protein NDU88_006919 [Pleurodeles waltl]
MASSKTPFSSTAMPAISCPVDATERILQEMTAVGRRLEAMDFKITDLSAACTSIRANIAGFQDNISDLNQCLVTVKGQLVMLPERDSELQFLHAKITDLEDRSRRDNVRFFGIPNTQRARMSGLSSGSSYPFSLDSFQRAHRIGPPIKLMRINLVPLSLVFYTTSRPDSL